MLAQSKLNKKMNFKNLVLLFALFPTMAWLGASDKREKQAGPKPNQLVQKSRLLELTGKFDDAKLSKEVRILWLSGPEDHGGGEHDYIRVKELFVPMLKSISHITVEEAFGFPTQEQFDAADVLIQYIHHPDLGDKQFKMFRNFVSGGGGVVSIHESCIMRPIKQAEKLAGCIGCSWKGNRESKWSKFGHDHPLFLDTTHPAFTGLPKSVRFNDESYWNLLKSENVKVIGALNRDVESKSFAEILESDGVRSDAFWTYELGKGRVFGTTTGHFTYTYYDPVYRLLLMRGLGWVLNEDPAPLMPIVFEGITNDEGFVGTTDTMMNYKNRAR